MYLSLGLGSIQNTTSWEVGDDNFLPLTMFDHDSETVLKISFQEDVNQLPSVKNELMLFTVQNHMQINL